MEIKSDGTFHYELKAKNNLIAKGKWDRTDDLFVLIIVFLQTQQDAIPLKINGNELTLNENDVNFSFIKKETIKAINEKTMKLRVYKTLSEELLV